MKMQEEILDFLSANKVATICYVKNSLPYCFNCLYAIAPGIGGIAFKSSNSSLHTQEMQNEIPVAGTIYHASKSGFDNTGVQFEGKVTTCDEMYEIDEQSYYMRFPMAFLIPGRIFTIIFYTIKFSQTKNGIRRKINWQRAIKKAI